MIQSLESLETEIGFLNYYLGTNLTILNNIYKTDPEIDCISFNTDWTPYAKNEIKK